MSEKKILISGVGNPYRRDDGIGIEIIKIFGKENTNSQIEVFDGATDAFSLFDQLSLYKKTIIIDAVLMDEKPGVVKIFSPDEAELKIKSDALSTHGFGLAEVLRLVKELDIKTDIKIIGIEPEDVGYGEGLSDIVKSKIPAILKLVKKELIDVF